MSFGNLVPIREDLLARAHPLIEKHKGSHVVLEYDVQLQTWPIGAPTPQLVNAWCLIVIVTGALLGPANYLSYTYTLGENPQVPDDRTLDTAVQDLFKRLGVMKMQQLRTNTPPNAN